VKKLWIDGKEADAASAVVRKIENPATLEIVDEVFAASAEDVHRATTSAAHAQPAWWKTPAVERAKYLHEAARSLRADRAMVSELLTREGGKPRIENLDEVEWCAACLDYYAELARSSYGNSVPPVAAHQLNFTIKEPLGVVAAIVPYNYPMLLLLWKLAPALAAGNSVVIKPAEVTPLATLRFVSKSLAHLPPGVVNVITGRGSQIGDCLVEDPNVACIAFTGSTSTGIRIAGRAAQHLKRVNLELGGIDPFIVFPDADLDVAVPGAVWARFLNAGQVCTSAKRMIVCEPLCDEFIERFVALVAKIKVGDGMDPETDMGPMVSAEALKDVERQVNEGVKAGAKLLCGGKRLPKAGPGHFYAPTVLTGFPPNSPLVREEVFGPVACIQRVQSADEAIALAADSEYGLGANIYTQNLTLAMRAMTEIKAGTFWINDPLTDNDAAPFGGMRKSGIGRELGEEGLDAFREAKHVHLDFIPEKKSYWFPYRNRRKEIP